MKYFLIVFSVFLIPFLAHAQAVELIDTPLFEDADLSAYYQLEDLTDALGVVDLTNVNSISFATTSVFNNGAMTDSNNRNGDQSLKTNSGLDETLNVSMSGWVKITLLPITGVNEGLEAVVIKSNDTTDTFDGFFVGYNGANYFVKYQHNKIGVGTTDLLYNFNYGTENFFHFATTYDGSTMRLYINGTEVGTPQSVSGNGSSNGQDCVIIFSYLGSNCTNYPGYSSTGVIDDLAFFSRVLTADEVADLYSGEWPAQEPEPGSGYYDTGEFYNDLTLIQTYNETWSGTNSSSTLQSVERGYLHVPLFAWLVLAVLYLWIMSRFVLELIIRLRQ